MEIKELLTDIINHKRLSREEAKAALVSLATGQFNEVQMAVFLTAYMMRKITVEELIGFREAMLEMCVKVDLNEYDAMDLCGTGGDGKDTFNISTLASFVVAGAGQEVVKHGNNGVSSVCGSSNLLAHFGHQFTNDETLLMKNLEEAGICFLHAPLFHPVMKNVAPVRKSLGLKTFFNMLGPMVNPAVPSKQLVGVFSLELARLYGYLYQKSVADYCIVHSLDGYDEISLTGEFKLLSVNGEQLITPEELGFDRLQAEQLAGGNTIKESARLFERVLKGEGSTAQNNVVIANAGVALHAGNPNIGFDEGIDRAKKSLDSGKALKCFKTLLES